MSTWLIAVDELCGNNQRVESIVVIILKNVSTHSPTTKSKSGIDFHGITNGGFVDGWTDRQTGRQMRRLTGLER